MHEIADIAKVAHEVNNAYCKAVGHPVQPKWEDAPENIKKSAVDGVLYHLNHPDAKPEDSHNNWLQFKIKDGWTYGETKDIKKKTHPALVPYDKLPVETKAKDYIFKSIVDHVKMLGLNFDRKFQKMREELLKDTDQLLIKELKESKDKVSTLEKELDELKAKYAKEPEPETSKNPETETEKTTTADPKSKDESKGSTDK